MKPLQQEKWKTELEEIERRLSGNYSLATLEKQLLRILHLTRRGVDPNLYLQCRILYGTLLFNSGRRQEALTMYTSLLEVADRVKNTLHLARIHHGLGIIYSVLGEATTSYEHLLQAYTIATENDHRYLLAKIVLSLGVFHSEEGATQEAIEYLEHCIKLAEEFNEPTMKARALLMVSEIELSRGNLDAAKRAADIAFRHCIDGNFLHGKVMSRIRLASIHIEEGNVANAEIMLNGIDGELAQLRAIPLQVSVELIRGKCRMIEKRFEESQEHFSIAYKLAQEIGNQRLQMNALQHSVEAHLHAGDTEAAKEVLKRLEDPAKEHMDSYSLGVWHSLWAQIAIVEDNYKLAYEHAVQHHKVEKQILSQEASVRLEHLQVRNEVERREREATSYRQQLHVMTEDLAERTAYLILQSDMLTVLQNDIRAIISNSTDGQALVKQIRSRLRRVPRQSTKWEEYDRTFRRTYPNFNALLEQYAPTLSRVERRVCALIKAGLTTSEMSTLLGISKRTIENHRYRLRRKLNLKPEQELMDLFDEFEAHLA